jgi:hypothetical protein
MSLPRSVAQATFAPAAVRNPAANDTFTSIAAAATTVFTFALPRSFRPQKAVYCVFPSGLQPGLQVGQVYITGNNPMTGAATKGYTLNVPISNTSAGALTPTAQKVTILQD